MGLHPDLLDSLNKIHFTKASPIQELTIPPIIKGKDIFAQAETGSGKTACFAIPIIQKILTNNELNLVSQSQSLYVILSPTRELAQQTHKVFHSFGKDLGIKAATIIGGESIDAQKELLKDGVHILVGTPGRMCDLIKQKSIDLSRCQGVVFDEADRLFDMGFQKDIEVILSHAPKTRQLIMVSATSNQEVLRTAYKFHSHPEEIVLNHDSLVVDHIDHQLAMMDRNEKFSFLVKKLRETNDAYAIVFCNTQFQTHTVAEWLKAMGFKANPISGRLAQNKRTQLLQNFRSKKITILVCTDVAARGLDIKNVNLVINYDLPSEAANYVHRIGRTGRAGEKGLAISLCSHEDCEYLEAIYEFIDSKIPKVKLTDNDFATDICKKPYIDKKTLKVVSSTQPTKNHERKQPRKKPTQAKPTEVKKVTTQTQTINSKPAHHPPRIDRRLFETTSKSYDSAVQDALSFFRMNEAGMLNHEVLKQGPKKFFFFGPRETTYKFTIKPIFKKILLPYLIETIKLAGLKLFVKISFKDKSLRVTFSGQDEKLLLNNRSDLLYAFEHLIKLYLFKKIILEPGTKISVAVHGQKSKNKKEMTEETLIKLAEELKEKVLAEKKPMSTKTLSPAERRIIHKHLQDNDKIQTQSIGQGRFKKVEINLV